MLGEWPVSLRGVSGGGWKGDSVRWRGAGAYIDEPGVGEYLGVEEPERDFQEEKEEERDLGREAVPARTPELRGMLLGGCDCCNWWSGLVSEMRRRMPFKVWVTGKVK